VEALRVASVDGGAHGFPGAHLFLDPFEYDHVRVGGHAYGQDHSREARQGQRHVQEQDDPVEERGVDRQPDHGDHAEEAVEQEQEQGDDQEADAGGDLRLP